ncbi:MAG: insulinase family protein [Firmicutes bacterium]|nr:insulinase family protein [Bacillota bacterium]
MNRIKRKILVLLAGILLFSTSALAAVEEFVVPEIEYDTFELDNGLKVYVIEDDSIPLVEVAVFYKVGSIDEEPGQTGISHFLEHTMFLGTESLGKGWIEQLITAVGGSYNAATSFDFTYYFFEVPSSMLELAIAIEADRMGNLKIDPEDIEREREVIRQERRSGIENNVFSAGLEQVQAAAFPNSSLNHQVIGWMDDINSISVENINEYYQNYYVPNNAVMIVTGDAKLDEVKKLTEKYLAGYEATEVIRPSFTVEKQETEITLELPFYTNIPIILMLYKTPQGNELDVLNAAVFLNILVNNESSRIKQELQKNKQLIIETAAILRETREPSYTLLYMVPASMEYLRIAQDAFDYEVKRIITEGVTQEELDMVRKAVLKNLIFSQKEKAAMASSIAVGSLNYDEPELFRTQLEHLADLTVEDIQATAVKYFNKSNRVVGNIVPIN